MSGFGSSANIRLEYWYKQGWLANGHELEQFDGNSLEAVVYLEINQGQKIEHKLITIGVDETPVSFGGSPHNKISALRGDKSYAHPNHVEPVRFNLMQWAAMCAAEIGIERLCTI